MLLYANAGSAQVVNGGFEEVEVRESSDAHIQALLGFGWKFEDAIVWPVEWRGWLYPPDVMVRVVEENPHSGKKCLLLHGPTGSPGYMINDVKGLGRGLYKASFWARGKGTATLMVGGAHMVLSAQTVDKWEEYAGVFRNTGAAYQTEVILTIQSQRGETWFDDVTLTPCDVLDAAFVAQREKIRKEGKWLSEDAPVDVKLYKENISSIEEIMPELEKYISAYPIPENLDVVRMLAEKTVDLAGKEKPDAKDANLAIAYARIAKDLLEDVRFVDLTEGKDTE